MKNFHLFILSNQFISRIRLALAPLLFVLFIITPSCENKTPAEVLTYSVTTTFSFSGTETWPERHHIALGAFSIDSVNPIVHNKIDISSENESMAISLNNVPENIATINLYLANIANQPVFIFYKNFIGSLNNDITIPHQEINLIKFDRLQAQVFNACIACHGGSNGEPAAGLNLTAGNSYSNLLEISAVNSSKKRVVPNNINESFIIDVLRKKQKSFTHTASNTIAEEDIVFIEQWILHGAKK